MFLDKVRTIEYANGSPVIEPVGKLRDSQRQVFDKWKDWHPSEISHHGRICCEIAREWITATDFSESASGGAFTGPRWLRNRFDWGASSFPIYWCEVVQKRTLDCGALAALADEIFKFRGVKSYRIQMVQRFSQTATAQWENSWNAAGESLAWTQGDLIYHEGCAISPAGSDEIKIWDASAGWWVDPNAQDGYGSLLAARLAAKNLSPDAQFIWGRHRLDAFRWTRVG